VNRVRVKPWEDVVTVSHPQTGQWVTPDRSQYYRADDPLVETHSWLFASDEEIAAHYGDTPAEPTRRRTRA